MAHTHKNKKLIYLSHGKQVTGGYLHEHFLAEHLYLALGSEQYQYRQKRFKGHYEGIWQHLKLVGKAFAAAGGHVQICVARLGIPVMLRNLFSQHKTIIVWHYYDDYDGKSTSLQKWYMQLLKWISVTPGNRVALVVVAPFWEEFFKNTLHQKPVFLFPNLFNNRAYEKYVGTLKKKQIHLGQVSNKNSNELFLIAAALHERGYHCYFSTLDKNAVRQHDCYEVKYFETHAAYLEEMAASEYTLAMPFFREGWNRVAHESLLVGTQVIGFDKGGLGNLLKGANAFIVGAPEEEAPYHTDYRNYQQALQQNPVRETIEIITSQKQKVIQTEFLKSFDVSQTGQWLIPILDWCRS